VHSLIHAGDHMRQITVVIVGTGWIGKKTTNPSRVRRAIKYARDENNADKHNDR
jgi:hypothetical protein